MSRSEIALYRRNAAHITSRRVLHTSEKDDQIAECPRLKRRKMTERLRHEWDQEERRVQEESLAALVDLRGSLVAMREALADLAGLKIPELLGKVEGELQRLEAADHSIDDALTALRERDFGAAGAAANDGGRALWLIGGPLIVTLNVALSNAAIGKEHRQRLQANLAARKEAKAEMEELRKAGDPARSMAFAASVHRLEAEGFQLAADILGTQIRKDPVAKTKIGRDGALRVVPPQELETFADVGGLDDVKEQLRATIGTILERPDEAARYQVVHNGILFHGPPGTGKTLLSRALAGEYGLRYIRFNPAQIASAYIHEAAKNLQRLFELASESTPCLLFLDEVDTIAGPRDDQPSADHREVVTQLMNALEEYRATSGLVIVAATNNIDRLDPGLREGRFDAKILVPLPDPQARQDVIRVHLERRGDAVDLSGINFEALSKKTHGRNAAALEGFVTQAAQIALRAGRQITQEVLLEAIDQREGKDRRSLDEPVYWDDVVLPDDTRGQVMEILNVFSHPDLARSLGVKPPAGILLHGPPGTGKTTIARAMATEVSASFYEQSAADLLSKWVGESEERVAKLFSKARANRPSIIFIDEIDSLLRQRSDEAAPWENRVISQFLRELDGLTGGDGVLLVGATNRIDIIDPAIQGRRLTPIEVGLPDAVGRLQLLRVLFKSVSVGDGTDFKRIAGEAEGMSGADLKRLRDASGMKALTRATTNGGSPDEVAISMSDLLSALETMRNKSTLVQV